MVVSLLKISQTMRTDSISTQTDPSGSNIFLTGAILLAQMDAGGGLLDYAIKAVIGGMIWMAFKVGSEYITTKFKEKENERR